MKVVDVDLAKGVCESDDILVKIELNESNLNKFCMAILYSCEKNYKKFVLDYSPLNFSECFSSEKAAIKISEQVLNLVRNHGIEVYIKGFARCLFESYFLPRHLKFEFSSKIFFMDSDYDGEQFEKDVSCLDCMFNSSCNGILGLIKDKIKPVPLQSNLALSTYYQSEFDSFFNSELKDLSDVCIQDFKIDLSYGIKKIFFREKVSEGSDSFKEGFFYRVFNLKPQFDDFFNFIINIYGDLLIPFRQYLVDSGVFVLGFEVLSDNLLRKRLYFSLENLNEFEKRNLFEEVKFDYEDVSDIDGVTLEFFNGSVTVNEITRRYSKVSVVDLKQKFVGFNLEQKRIFLKFMNSFIRDLSSVFVREEYEMGVLVSKKCEVSMKDNLLKIKHLSILFGYRLAFLQGKDIKSICVEVSEFAPEKVVFFYALKLPERVLEFEDSIRDY